jgi:hypothetical protein
MTTYTHRAILVPAAYAPLARQLCEAFAPISGPGMFVTPVYDNAGVIRYYASNGPIDADLAALVDDPTGDALWAAIQAAGAQVPEAAVRAMMAGAIVRSDCAVLDLIAADPELYGHNDPRETP